METPPFAASLLLAPAQDYVNLSRYHTSTLSISLSLSLVFVWKSFICDAYPSMSSIYFSETISPIRLRPSRPCDAECENLIKSQEAKLYSNFPALIHN